MLRVARVTESEYEWTQHERLGRNPGVSGRGVLANPQFHVLMGHSNGHPVKWGSRAPGVFSDNTKAYVSELQEAAQPAGIKVLGVKLNDLTYAPEIAQAMLMRQQALAMVDARKTIVEGAVEIVRDAVERLARAGLELTASQQEQLVANLLVVLCSGEHAQPVLQVHAGRN